jgi:hypothetical protein
MHVQSNNQYEQLTNLRRSEIKDVAINGECNIRHTGQTAAVHCWVSIRIRQMITDLVDTLTQV